MNVEPTLAKLHRITPLLIDEPPKMERDETWAVLLMLMLIKQQLELNWIYLKASVSATYRTEIFFELDKKDTKRRDVRLLRAFIKWENRSDEEILFDTVSTMLHAMESLKDCRD